MSNVDIYLVAMPSIIIAGTAANVVYTRCAIRRLDAQLARISDSLDRILRLFDKLG